VLKYPDPGFLKLFVLALAIEAGAFGLVQPYVISGPHGIAFSAAFALALSAVLVTGGYYFAKVMAWLLFRFFPPRP
jgi:hypothetical protein